MEALASRRRKSVLRFVVRLAAMIAPPLRLVNYLLFLFQIRRGDSRRLNEGGEKSDDVQAPATLPMRLAGLTYAPAAASSVSVMGAGGFSSERHVNFSYAYRRLLYEETYALAAVLLLPSARAAAAMAPVLRARIGRGRRRIVEATRRAFLTPLSLLTATGGRESSTRVRSGAETEEGGEDDDDERCPVCSRSPFASSVPYRARPCGHAHCYVCLRTAALDDPDYSCRRCGTRVDSSGPA